MFQERTMLVSLDIYDTPIVSVIAKQYDSNSRFVEAVCTENGVKFSLNSEEHKAIIVCNKPDDTVVVNDATILSNGNVLIELTQQMLAVHGRCTCDVMILSADGEIDTNDLDIDLLESYALSPMSFYLDVKPFATSNEVILSTNECKTFVKYINSAIVLEREIQKNEADRQDLFEKNEAARKNTFDTNERNRTTTFDGKIDSWQSEINETVDKAETAIKNCEDAVIACENVIGECGTAVGECEDAVAACGNAVSACETAVGECKNATTNAGNATTNATNAVAACENVIGECETAIGECDAAAKRANQAAEDCEGIADGTSLVLKSDLYDENNLVKNSKLNTSFTNQSKQVIVSGEELSVMLGKIAAYMNAFDNRQQILYNASNPSAEPDNSVGNNGDIYVKVIQE